MTKELHEKIYVEMSKVLDVMQTDILEVKADPEQEGVDLIDMWEEDYYYNLGVLEKFKKTGDLEILEDELRSQDTAPREQFDKVFDLISYGGDEKKSKKFSFSVTINLDEYEESIFENSKKSPDGDYYNDIGKFEDSLFDLLGAKEVYLSHQNYAVFDLEANNFAKIEDETFTIERKIKEIAQKYM